MNFKKTFITLSNIDVNEHTEKKGQFTYLSWTWAWKTLVENTESAAYIWNEDKVFSDGTMEVSCSLTVNDHTLPMWLAVTDYKNEAIKEPDSHSINTARMRCLVKAMAMFGLGHYIYAGESFPLDPVDTTKLNGARNVPADSLLLQSSVSSNSGSQTFIEDPDATEKPDLTCIHGKINIGKLLDTVPLVGYAVKDNKTYRDCLERIENDINYWGSRNNLTGNQKNHLRNLRAIKLHKALATQGVIG